MSNDIAKMMCQELIAELQKCLDILNDPIEHRRDLNESTKLRIYAAYKEIFY